MKRLLFVVAVAWALTLPVGAQRFVRIVNTLAEALATNPNDNNNVIFIRGRLTPGDGFEGEFYPVHNTSGLNLGTKFAMTSSSGSGWALQRLVPDKVYNVLWFAATTPGAPTHTQMQNAFDTAVGATLLFPPNGSYLTTDRLNIQSNTHVLGYGATLGNGDLNKQDFVLLQTTNKYNVIVEGLTIDVGENSHYDTGGLWFRGSTNCVAKSCIFKNGGYLGWMAIVGYPDSSQPSVFCGAVNCTFLDLRYGGSNQSLAGLSIAESPWGCFAINNFFDFPTLSTRGLSYVALGAGDPNAPRLVSSFDRAFQSDLRGNVYYNTSSMTNLVGMSIEDNSGATNVVNHIRDNYFTGYEIGVQFALLNGDFSMTGGSIVNCSKYGVRLNQTEAADQHGVRTLTLRDVIFRGNYQTPTFGTSSGDWNNLGGNISFVANSPQRLYLENVRFYGWGGNTNQTGVLFGGGDLYANNCYFQDLGYGIKAMDPVYPITADDRGFYNAGATNRHTFVQRGSKHVNVTHPVWGLSDTYGADNLAGDQSRYYLDDYFVAAIPTNTVSTILTIQSTHITSSQFGTAGAYDADIDLIISNQAPPSTSGPFESFMAGQVSGRKMGFAFSYAANFDASPQAAVTPVVSTKMTPQVKATGSGRGFTNLTPSVVVSPWHTTAVKLSADTETSDVSTVYVYGKVRIAYTGFFLPPQIIK